MHRKAEVDVDYIVDLFMVSVNPPSPTLLTSTVRLRPAIICGRSVSSIITLLVWRDRVCAVAVHDYQGSGYVSVGSAEGIRLGWR